MNLKDKIMASIKEAMRSKDKIALETLRAVKAELLKLDTASGSSGELNVNEEMGCFKMQKQRKDAATIYIEQGRSDLADDEIAQSNILSKFLPTQMTTEELEKAIIEIIQKLDASGPSDMGKVMGLASRDLLGKSDGRTIADTVKRLLNQ